MIGDHAQVHIQRVTALRQRQHIVTAWQGFVGLGQIIARRHFVDQFLIIKYVHVQAGQIGGKNAQDLFVFVGHQSKAHP